MGICGFGQYGNGGSNKKKICRVSKIWEKRSIDSNSFISSIPRFLWRFCLRSIDSGRLSVLYISPVVSRLRALPFSSGCLSTSLRSPRLHVSPVVSRLSSPDSPLLKQAAPSSQFPHSLSFTVFKATRYYISVLVDFVCDLRWVLQSGMNVERQEAKDLTSFTRAKQDQPYVDEAASELIKASVEPVLEPQFTGLLLFIIPERSIQMVPMTSSADSANATTA
ncbi:zinc finger BED domain-containing protein RICESLEEPER 2-like [Raphanus sativus]|nr:zinc finger BED domain-containing protein RICESLEEPER 2-like [Raphanus sativus]